MLLSIGTRRGEYVRNMDTSGYFAPNPVSVGLPTVLSVVVIDAQGGEREDLWYSGELQAGEV